MNENFFIPLINTATIIIIIIRQLCFAYLCFQVLSAAS